MEEAGCAVCGQLTPVSQLTRLKAIKNLLHILQVPGTTRVEQKSVSQPVQEFKGPVLDYKCNQICNQCQKHVSKRPVLCVMSYAR